MRSKTTLLLSVKLVLVGLVVAWLYSRSEVDMKGERVQVVSARGTLSTAADGTSAPIQLDAEQARNLYDLAHESGWALRASGPPRATFDILYEGGSFDHVEVTGIDRVTVNGSSRSVDEQLLQAVMLAAQRNRSDPLPTTRTGGSGE